MNQITDISMNEKYASLLGYTQEELELYFPEYIEILAQKKRDFKKKELLREIKHWYNGYSWDAITRVYNPFSILSLFQSLRFDNYWFSSGTPSHLIKLMKEKKIQCEYFEIRQISSHLIPAASKILTLSIYYFRQVI